MANKESIFLIDGSSYLYRAFHAMPPLTTSNGLPTGAIKGVVNMLRNLKKDDPDQKIITVFDAKGKNFRHNILNTYKANRPPMPEELVQQLDPLKKICNLMGAPVVEVKQVEADDVIATLCKTLKKNFNVIISSLDKDLMQLVEDHSVCMKNTMTNDTFNEAGVFKKMGVRPNQIVDYLAMVGDSSDNIPGVPKVGPKTAAKWLSEYKDMNNIIKNAESLTGAVGNSFRESLGDLDRNKLLVSLKDDVDIGPSLDLLLKKRPDHAKLQDIFRELEFNAWLDKDQNDLKPINKSQQYKCILSKDDLLKVVTDINKAEVFSIDTETDSLDKKIAKLIGISISTKPNTGIYIPMGHKYPGVPAQLDLKDVIETLKNPIEKNQHKIVGQNLKYDLPILNNHGFSITDFHSDTMILSYVFNSTASRHGLDNLAKNYLDYDTLKYKDLVGTGKKTISFSEVTIEDATEYASEDADLTLRLFHFFSEKLASQPTLLKLLEDIENPTLKTLINIENNGVKIDKSMLEGYSKELSKQISSLRKKAFKITQEEFNLDSPKQLLEVLYHKQGLPVLKKTPKGQPSTNEETLQRLAEEYDLPKIILEYRGLAKLKSTYTDSLVKMIHPLTKRVHTSYQQAVTSTGRLSSTEPNLQNIPIKTSEGRKIREAFIPEEGKLILSADYSQIELRIMAHLSKDKNLTKAFNSNLDVHASTASEIFNIPIEDVSPDHRRKAKAINFGLMYGMSAFGLTRQLGISRKDAQDYLDAYFVRYQGVETYLKTVREQAKSNQFVETILGRKVHVPEINSGNGLRRQASERAAINGPLQGSAADIIKKAMIDIYQWTRTAPYDIQIIMQVHDELIFEAEQDHIEEISKQIKNTMENTIKLSVPLLVDINSGKNWNEAH